DFHVTGVQTCALPILPACEGQEAPSQVRAVKTRLQRRIDQTLIVGLVLERRMQQVEIPDDNRQKIVENMGEPARQLADGLQFQRSEERRVGKGGESAS